MNTDVDEFLEDSNSFVCFSSVVSGIENFIPGTFLPPPFAPRALSASCVTDGMPLLVLK